MFTPELVTVLWRLEPNGDERSAVVSGTQTASIYAKVGDELHAQVFTDIRRVVHDGAEWRAGLEALQ